jgi:glycosyltransferase involved in cell wall biosynthesis
MRITVDCFAVQSKSSGQRGIGNYARDFLANLLNSSGNIEVTLLACMSEDYSEIEEIVKQTYSAKKVSLRLWDPLISNTEVLTNGDKCKQAEYLYREVIYSTQPDKYVILSPFELEYPWSTPSGIYSISIFYDAIPAIYSERYLENSTVKEKYFDIVTKLSAFNELLCISVSSLHDAEEVLGLVTPKKTLINFGLQEIFKQNPNVGMQKDPKMAFAVLGGDDRKNKINLLRAWKKCLEVESDLQLLISYQLSESEKLVNNSLLKELELEHNVKFLGYISTDELLQYYSKATLHILPSLYEGLGLPILEAYAAGTGSIVSNVSSLPELCEDIRLQFDPNDPEDISKKILNYFRDPILQHDAMISGLKVISKFQPEAQRKKLRSIFSKNKPAIVNNDKHEDTIEKVYVLTPLKPEKTGIADYFNSTIHEFHTRIELILVNPEAKSGDYLCPECFKGVEFISPANFAAASKERSAFVYNIGNSSFHTWQHEIIREFPGLVILHDVFLSGLEYTKALETSSEEVIQNLIPFNTSTLLAVSQDFQKDPIGNFLTRRINRAIVENATSVIVHTAKAKDLLLEDFVLAEGNEIKVISLPVKPKVLNRQVTDKSNVIGVFGRIAEAKMYKEILSAWEISKTGNSGVYELKFVGESFAPTFEFELEKIGKKYNVSATENFSEVVYDSEIAKVLFAIQLRRSSRGESSGALLDVVAASVPVIINNLDISYSISSDLLNVIPEDFTTIELANSIDTLITNHEDAMTRASLASEQLLLDASPKIYVSEILTALQSKVNSKEYFPVSVLKRLVSNQRANNVSDLRTLVDSCIRSFPVPVRSVRLLILASEDALQTFAEKEHVIKIMEKLVDRYHFPIYVVRESGRLNTFQTVHSFFVEKEVSDLLRLSEVTLVLRPTDIVLEKDNSTFSDFIEDSDWKELKEAFWHFLAKRD